MLAHHVIGKGKAAYLAALADPQGLAAEVPAMTPQTGMYYFSLFRFEQMVFDAQKARLLLVLSAPYDEQKKAAAIATKPEDLVGFPRFVDRIARVASGYYCFIPTALENFIGPRYDRGYPELYPKFRELPTGEIMVAGYTKPPPGVPVEVAPSTLPAE
jgi:hypothetical protein